MVMRQILDVYDLLDRADVTGAMVEDYMRNLGAEMVHVVTMKGPNGKTDMIRITIPGKRGKLSGGTAPTLGILGRLGGLGARPTQIGFVSDGEGALVALAAASKLLDMKRKGDNLDGDVVVCTHICPDAPTMPHTPVPFMGTPIDMATVNRYEVTGNLDAILSVDTTKGNRIINTRGFAISPTVKEGYILKVSEDILDIMQSTSGKLPCVFALSMQDITPYGNELFHLNSILQPSTATAAPVVGVAITTETTVAGSATGTSHVVDLEETARFVIEIAKAFGCGKCQFYDTEEFDKLVSKYGEMKQFQTLGK